MVAVLIAIATGGENCLINCMQGYINCSLVDISIVFHPQKDSMNYKDSTLVIIIYVSNKQTKRGTDWVNFK